MRHAKTLRIASVAVLIAITGNNGAVDVLPPARATVDVVRPQIEHVDNGGLSADQRSLLGWAQSRFSQAELQFPRVTLRFHDDLTACGGHVGLFYPESDVLHMCRLDKRTALHELAHAWVDENLSRADKVAFVERRGLNTWGSHETVWDLRGTEHAAEILTWALMDENSLVRWISEGPDGVNTSTHRLLTIPDSEPDQLLADYEFLTGRIPTERVQDDPRLESSPEASSPEARRFP